MPSHEGFEELCALAAAGEISAAEQHELTLHLEGCASCREVFRGLKNIHSTWLPQREGFEIERSVAAEAITRRTILRQAEQKGARFSDEAQLPVPLEVPSTRAHNFRYLLAIAAALVAVLGSSALWLHLGSHASISKPSATKQSTVGEPQQADTSELEMLRESVRANEEARVSLEASLKKVQADRLRLEQQLDETERRAHALEQASSSTAEEESGLQAQLDAVRSDYAKVAAQLVEAKVSLSDKETQLALDEAENKALGDRLDEEMASVGRERELMADGREIRDLIAARNLHIIDVYDTGGDGRTQKSFGRVFYTEGKSLVFYAYDLQVRRPAAKYAFYAWGKRDVSGDARVRNLGIFYNDDQAQKRWVLRVSDPQILSEIDSVFVTVEKSDGVANAPTGKELLSAYLGTLPNHP